MKKLALFGATGQTGREFLKLALPEGYELRAMARNPDDLKIEHENLEVIQGDVLNESDVEEVVIGTDVVVSLFGHVKDSPKWLQTNGTKNIVKAMKKEGIDKIISLSGGGLPYEKDKPKIPDYLIKGAMKLFAGHLLEDAKKHAEVLKESGLDWIIVRGPRLTNGERKGDYRVGWVGVNAGTKISRPDLADFILKQVESDEFIEEMPFVSY